ncbi:MAG: tetratricopeptide repeat protein [Hyphomicrobiales bacterium]|nr:tetratricopeptide repeat protein [Hyphomicrobiales bacterium]
MNRKERRAARSLRGKRVSPAQGASPQVLSTNLFASAIDAFNAGRLDEAERACRDVLMFDKAHFDALHMLGVIASRIGNLDAAQELYRRALAINPRNAECHFNLAQVMRSQERHRDAIDHLAEATALRPDYVAAHIALGDMLATRHDLEGARSCYQQALAVDARLIEARHGLANVLRQLDRLDEAGDQFRQVLALRPDFAEAHSNLGVVLAVQGRMAEAAEQYQRALAIKPELADVYRNLARALLALGRSDEALGTIIRGLAVGESDAMRAMFVQCVQSMSAIPPDPPFRDLVARALDEGWGRAAELSPMAAYLFMVGDVGGAAIDQAMALPEPPDTDSGLALLGSLADDPLLHALLTCAPVRNATVERFLTRVRSALLQLAARSEPDAAMEERVLRIAAALARQCFINEYVFAQSDAEAELAQTLRDRLERALSADGPAPAVWIAALGCYAPLHALAQAQRLLQRSWPEPLAAVLAEQVEQPALERELAATLPALTTIDDETSLRVRQQYEDMPYPRWIKISHVGEPTNVDWYLRSQFPGVAFRPVQTGDDVDVLIAGCGTGQHAIETGQRIAGARVLAIDLSRASLGYAARKTREARLRNIAYAQADILHLGSLGATFDVIEASGVLHHLGDPERGWRTLLALLRPGGVMHIGLYSATARADIRAARAFIAERGYRNTADDIRRCRQELLALADDTPIKNVTQYSDFFTTSECRDLLFHAQEHEFTIEAIRNFLIENDLAFLGFTGPVAQAYGARFPDDPSMTDLDRWDIFERENPLAFVNMYQFWVQKTGS